MAGLFCNDRVRSFMIVVFAIMVVQRIDGYPYQWPEFFSFTNTKQPMKESLNETDLSTSVSKDYERGGEIVASGQTIHYAESSLTYDGIKGESRIVETAQEKRTIGLDDDENNNSNFEKAKKNDNDDYNSEYDDDYDEENYDKITELIEHAIKDGIFLTAEKLAQRVANNLLKIPDDDEGASVKKPRSPSEPQNKVTQNTRANIGDRIVFPDEVRNGKLNDFTPRPVPSCENMTFCVDSPYYPSDSDVDNALAKRYLEPVTEPSTIAQRIGGEIDEPNGLCISTEEVVSPKTALDQNNKWRYVLNNEKYEQTVRVEVCKTSDTACGIIDSLLTGYKTSCKQKYIYRKLVALGTNGTESIPFQMPASCCCHVKFTGHLLSRIGIDVGRNNPQTPVHKRNNN